MLSRVQVKICGLTESDDALYAAQAGADALGLNFWPQSPRFCSLEAASAIVEAVGDDVRLVGVFVDPTREEVEAVRAVGVRWIQLHGDETPEALEPWLPHAYKALHLARSSQLDAARAWPGEELLVDARLPGVPGGTGLRCDWPLAARLAAERKVWLAGGLRPENVEEAVRAVRPYGVDVASGVESAPGVKDRTRMAEFVRRARAINPA